jgi:hypothetical protein
MNVKLIGLMMLVIMLSMSVFAAPAVTASNPGTLTNDSTATLTFTLKDENSASNIVDKLYIYYSATSGAYSNLIVYDANVQDASRVICTPDYNLETARTCTYTWTVPSSTTIPAGYWYIDYNFIPNSVNANVGYKVSSTAFKVETITGCTTMVWTFGLIVLVLAAFGAMRLLNGSMDIKTLSALAIVIIIGIIIITQFMQSVCVIV